MISFFFRVRGASAQPIHLSTDALGRVDERARYKEDVRTVGPTRQFARVSSISRCLLLVTKLPLYSAGHRGNSKGLFYQIGCKGESVGLHNRLLDPASIVPVSRVVQHLI